MVMLLASLSSTLPLLRSSLPLLLTEGSRWRFATLEAPDPLASCIIFGSGVGFVRGGIFNGSGRSVVDIVGE